ncbi:MAG: DUF523 domain-containing protein [Clostridioides sp.]|jgi:uncharacterized protein YbbK (DUF523 family)|nr:DUF523 domain-containing protein [Clostridioides sp.]
MILVSACLLGVNCKYSGKNNFNIEVNKYLEDKEFVPICPEQLGGLATPRLPAEIKKNESYLQGERRVFDCEGNDVTDKFIKGAKETLSIAKLCKCTQAILKDGSPSCGYREIYDGTFSGRKIKGIGVTTALLKQNNIQILQEFDIIK